VKDTGVRALANHCKDLGKSLLTPLDPFVRFYFVVKMFLFIFVFIAFFGVAAFLVLTVIVPKEEIIPKAQPLVIEMYSVPIADVVVVDVTSISVYYQ
jgi:hypothetical protein